MLFLYKFANTARFAEEKKPSANFYFILLLEEKMTAAAESDSTFARWAYAHYFQFVRDKDTKNLIVKCTLCVKPKDLSTSLCIKV